MTAAARRGFAIGAAALAGLAAGARADPGPGAAGAAGAPGAASGAVDLRVRALPSPRHLRMRAPRARRAADAAPAPAPDVAPGAPPAAAPDVAPAPGAPPGAPAPLVPDDAAAPAPLRARADRAARRALDPSDPAAAVHFRMDLGFVVDGAQPSGNASLSGSNLATTPGYDATRGYGFGDLYVGSHGLALPSLSTYLAAHATFLGDTVNAPPLPTVYDRTDALMIRSAWAESDGPFEAKWLAPLRVRAGRQYVYGPAPAHLDGVVVGWEARVLRVHVYAGSRVPDFAAADPSRDTITGVDARLDLGAWRRFPAVLDGSAFRWGDHQHAELAATVSRDRSLVLRGSVRALDGDLAHENVTAHLRVSDVTGITAVIDHRSSYDWRWDPSWVSATEPGAARRYLELGAVGPRALASVRAGTVLLDNVDLLVRAAGALDQHRIEIPDSSFATTWGEVGAAVEVRLRRTLAIGGSALLREYRPEREDPILTGTNALRVPSTGAPLPASAAMGEQSFVEAGLSARYSTGARRLSAEVELAARRVRFHRLYDVAESGLPWGPTSTAAAADLRGGGRFSLEAWVTPRFRLRAEYELSTGLDLVPEVLGYKSLRIVAEGSL